MTFNLQFIDFLKINFIIITDKMHSNKEQQNQQITLLRSYTQTLQRQNDAKNHERQILYNQIESLKQEHEKVLTILMEKDQQIESHHFYRENVQAHIVELQRKIELFYLEGQDKENYIYGLQENNQKLSTINSQFSQKLYQKQNEEIGLRNQIKQLNEELQNLQKQISQVSSSSQNSAVNISQLIQNYEKIEILSKEREKQNEELKLQNSRLEQVIDHLRQNLHRKQSKNIHLRNGSDTTLPYFPQTQQLVIQNNELIERITALEKQKNLFYAELTGKQWTRQTSNTHLSSERPILKNSTGQYMNLSPFKASNSSSKLQNRIDTLRTQNQNLLKSLRLD